jgi:glycosyltransferase involved in cell wall biosynthesis
MRVLFYYPSNKQSNALETLIYELKKRGCEIVLLTTCEKGDFHKTLESFNIKTYTHIVNTKGILYYLKQCFFLINFCRKHKIDIVCSHLQHVNFIAVFAQFFIKSKVIVFRHHFKFHIFSNDCNLKPNKNEELFDRVINKLAKIIVVPSSGVFNGMIEHEGVNKDKLRIIPYVYNFDKYPKPDAVEVEKIKALYPCKLRLLMCSRLILFKRHYIVFPVIKKLVEEGFDIKLLVLDEGPEKENLEQYIKQNNLQNHIIMLGFRRDFINYMAACDLLIHPSLTEASNSTVKEMGLLKKAVAVCSKVGDFDDYIVNEQNGFLLSPVNTDKMLYSLIKELYLNTDRLLRVGENLHTVVTLKYNKSETIINQYLELFNGLRTSRIQRS